MPEEIKDHIKNAYAGHAHDRQDQPPNDFRSTDEGFGGPNFGKDPDVWDPPTPPRNPAVKKPVNNWGARKPQPPQSKPTREVGRVARG